MASRFYMKQLVKAAVIAVGVMALVGGVARAETASAMQKIVAEYENTYGPMYMMWSDRNQHRLAAALIEEAQKDGKIMPDEGQIIENFKLEFGPMLSTAPEMLYAAQQTWLGHKCGAGDESCVKDNTYAIARKFVNEGK